MKIIDIISEDKALNEGAWTKWFTRPIEDYLERRAAAKLIAEIEKKYAKDIAKQTACKELSEKYGKYLAERELAGQSPIPLERLILKQKEYAGTSFAKDAEFIDLTTRLAQVKKTQYLKDGAQAGKAKDTTGASPVSGAVATTEDIIKRNEEVRKRVSERIKWINTTYKGFLGAQLLLILYDYDEEINTIDGQAMLGKIPASDVKYFPPVTTPGVAVTSDAKYATQWHLWGSMKTDIPYSYDNEISRIRSWQDWRDGMALQTMWQKFGAFAGSIWASGKLISKLGKTGWITDFAKWLDAMDKNTGVVKRFLGMAALSAASLLNKTGQLIFVNKMSSDDMNEVFKAILVGNLTETLPEAARKTIEAGFTGIIPHQVALLAAAKLIKSIVGATGNAVPPRTLDTSDPTSDVDAANPMQKDPSQQGNNTSVDQTDSTVKQSEPVAKPEEKNTTPEKKAADNTRPEDSSTAGRGAKFSAAKEAGAATVVIGGVTYQTADFVDAGRYWKNNKTGESFLKN